MKQVHSDVLLIVTVDNLEYLEPTLSMHFWVKLLLSYTELTITKL